MPSFFDNPETPSEPARVEAVENWLRTEVAAAYDELRADPSIAISSAELRAHLTNISAQSPAETP